jgi:pimeloyl-ACP methyl ester carboxylesterase
MTGTRSYPTVLMTLFVNMSHPKLSDKGNTCIMIAMNKKTLTTVGLVLYVPSALLATTVAGWFLGIAQTWTGRGLALWGLLLVWLPLVRAIESRATGSSRLSLAYALTMAGIVVAILATTPAGCALNDNAHAQSRFVGNATHLPRFSLTNVVPEIEQINVGLALIPYLDPIIDRRQARRLSSLILPAYREMEAGPEFHRLGSAMGWAYAEVLKRPFAIGHYYLYVPRNHPPGPLPAILFLHGSAGNFKVYTWAWSRFAEEHGYAIIAPSFGFGNWYRSGGVQAVEQALADARTAVSLDDERIYLAGLSNGGTGVSQVAAEMPEQFQGLIYISGVIEPSIVTSVPFLESWQERPVLVIHGRADRRIPATTARSAAEEMKAYGVAVSYVEYPGEDHFLFLARLDEVLDNVAGWME